MLDGRSIDGDRAGGVGRTGFSAFYWSFAGLLGVAWVAIVALSAPVAPSPTLAKEVVGPELHALEAAVSRSPGDVDALDALVVAYLERSAPGLAQAAIDRSPPAIRGLARVADLEARSLSALGLVEAALRSQERAIKNCRSGGCSNRMLVYAERRLRWLRELARLNASGLLLDSRAASLAYRLAVREVRLALP